MIVGCDMARPQDRSVEIRVCLQPTALGRYEVVVCGKRWVEATTAATPDAAWRAGLAIAQDRAAADCG